MGSRRLAIAATVLPSNAVTSGIARQCRRYNSPAHATLRRAPVRCLTAATRNAHQRPRQSHGGACRVLLDHDRTLHQTTRVAYRAELGRAALQSRPAIVRAVRSCRRRGVARVICAALASRPTTRAGGGCRGGRLARALVDRHRPSDTRHPCKNFRVACGRTCTATYRRIASENWRGLFAENLRFSLSKQ